MVNPILHTTFSPINPEERRKQKPFHHVVVKANALGSFENTLFNSLLSHFGIGPESTVEVESERYIFSLQFLSNRNEKFFVDGFINSSTQTFHSTVSYSFERIILENGSAEDKNYTLTATIDARNFLRTSVLPLNEHDLPLTFFHNIVNDIFDRAHDDANSLTGLLFQQEDMATLIGLNSDRIVHMFYTLLEIIHGYAGIKKIKIGGENEPLHDVQEDTYSGVKISFTVKIDDAT